MITINQSKVLPPDTMKLAEDHIGKHFSTARLLQAKVWWDSIPHEQTPKLAALFAWATGVTVQAVQGATTFAEPPFTFEEIAVEALTQ